MNLFCLFVFILFVGITSFRRPFHVIAVTPALLFRSTGKKTTDLHRNIWTMVLRCVRLHLRNRFLCPTAGFDSVAEDVPYEQLGKPKSSVEITTSGKFFCIWSLIIPFSHILVQMKHFEKIFGCVMARIASKLVILCRIHHCLQFELCDQDVGEIDVH